MFASGSIHRSLPVALMSLAGWLALGAAARPQSSIYGEWEDPIDLGDWLIKPPPEFAAEHADCTTGEIAHAVVLPPDDLANPETRVLFVCVAQYPGTTPAPGGGCDSSCEPNPAQIFGRSYLWRPEPLNRNQLQALDLPEGYPRPGDSDFGSQDLFCGGHTFLADGGVLWVGGTDYLRTCYTPGSNCVQPFYGHSGVQVLHTDTETPVWQAESSPAVLMSKNRWYPNAIQLANSDVFVFGHTLWPKDGPEFDDEEQQLYRDEYDFSGGVIATTATNSRPNTPYAADCPTPSPTLVEDYARMHLLSNGLLMQSIRAVDGGGQHILESGPSRFLDVKVQEWSCAQDETYHAENTDTWRWRDNGSAGTTSILRIGGSSVHLIAWDDSQVNEIPVDAHFTEVVYLAGGGAKDVGPDKCTGVLSYDLPNDVVRMLNPDIDTQWSDYNDEAEGGLTDNPPALNIHRALNNTVILLDGSLLTIGGVEPNGGTCLPVTYAERYEPEEIFGPWSGEDWDLLAEQAHKRSYHGVAFLLPDGTVVSGGGYDDSDPTPNSEHSLEVFRPPYMFATTARPSIILGTLHEESPPLSKDYNTVVEFDALYDLSTAPLRVALIRPGSVTHATDAGQRYVELALDGAPTHVTGRKWHLKVWMPLDEYYAPPGYYMLTVIDDEQVPSVAAWIHLE